MSKITVRKGNTVLDIDSEDKGYYMDKGYSVIDAGGRVVEEAMSQDVASLQLEVMKLKKENEELKKALAEKKEQPAEVKKPANRKKVEKADKE